MNAHKLTLSDGSEITIQAISPATVQMAIEKMKKMWRAEGRMVDPPKFAIEYENQLGEQRVWAEHFNDEKTGRNSLDDPDDPRKAAINWALWHEYERTAAELADAQTQAEFRLMVTHGIVDPIPADDGWTEKLTSMGLDVPEDPEERRFLYWWVGRFSAKDQATVPVQVQFLSVAGLATKEQQDLFQRRIQSSMEQAVGATFDRAIESLEHAVGPGMVPGQPAPGDAGSEVGGTATA